MGPSLLETVVVSLTIVLYALLLGSATYVLYVGVGGGALLPGSRFAVVQAYVVAVVFTGVVRILRAIRGA